MHGLDLYIYIIQCDHVFFFTGQAMMENIIRRIVKDEVDKHLSSSSTQKKRRSETRMANLLDKVLKGDHSHDEKMRKVHIKRKRKVLLCKKPRVRFTTKKVVHFALSTCH